MESYQGYQGPVASIPATGVACPSLATPLDPTTPCPRVANYGGIVLFATSETLEAIPSDHNGWHPSDVRWTCRTTLTYVHVGVQLYLDHKLQKHNSFDIQSMKYNSVTPEANFPKEFPLQQC